MEIGVHANVFDLAQLVLDGALDAFWLDHVGANYCNILINICFKKNLINIYYLKIYVQFKLYIFVT